MPSDWDRFASSEVRKAKDFSNVIARHDPGFVKILTDMTDGSLRTRQEREAALSQCRAYLADLNKVTPVKEYLAMTDQLRLAVKASISALEAAVAAESTTEPILDEAGDLYEAVHALSAQALADVQGHYRREPPPDRDLN